MSKQIKLISMAEFEALPDEQVGINEDVRQSQNDMVFRHLLAGNQLTQTQAFEKYKIWRLASRIKDIRNALEVSELYKGWKILTHTVRKGRKRYASYELVRVDK